MSEIKLNNNLIQFKMLLNNELKEMVKNVSLWFLSDEVFFKILIIEEDGNFLFSYNGSEYIVRKYDIEIDFPKNVLTTLVLPKTDEPICVITSNFISKEYILQKIVHEFVHCDTTLFYGNRVRDSLKFISNSDPTGELTFNFPYSDEKVIELFKNYKYALVSLNKIAIIKRRREIINFIIKYNILNYEFFEYNEWNEGKATLIEYRNVFQIVDLLKKIDINKHKRVFFYFSGAIVFDLFGLDEFKLISLIIASNGGESR